MFGKQYPQRLSLVCTAFATFVQDRKIGTRIPSDLTFPENFTHLRRVLLSLLSALAPRRLKTLAL